MAFATVLERARIELLAEDLNIFGYTLLADVTPSTMYFTTCIGYTYGRLDAVSVSAETTIDGRVLSPGIWYFPEDTGVGLADVNMMVQLPTGTTLTSVEVTAAVGSPPAAVSGQVSKDLLFEHYQWSTRFTVPLNTAETPVLERTHRVTNAAVITSPAVAVAGDHYGLVIEAGDSITLDGNVTPSPVRTNDTVVVMWYDGTTWRMIGAGAALAKNVVTFPAGDFTAEFYQDDLSTGIDGKLYVNVLATANITLPTVVGNSGKRVGISTDWSQRLIAAPNWITQGTTDIVGGAGYKSLTDPSNEMWNESGTDITWLVSDEANNRYIVMSTGDLQLSHVIPSFADDADVIVANLPAGSLFQGNGTGDLSDNLFRVKADLTRVVI